MVKVYIASPYTNGDTGANVRESMLAWERLADLGYAPFSPLWSHFQHIMFPRSYESWMELDLEWLSACDCVLRLPGESKGADMEVAKAKELGIPVFYDVGTILEELNPFDSLIKEVAND